jgi:hypothetical protein
MELFRLQSGLKTHRLFKKCLSGIADVDRAGKHPLYQRGDILAEHLDI